MQTNSSDLNGEDENTVREYLCIGAYLDAHDSFNDWFQYYQNAKPQQPQMPAGANFTERVAHEHRQKQYEAEMDSWRHSLMLLTEVNTHNSLHVQFQ